MDWKRELESIGDRLEGIARDKANDIPKSSRTALCALAWDLKQIARRGTASEGV